ncbi:MAG TPA: hypothetical protein VNZ64_22240 [Candidatus Acidoferrum sp.]|jgi:hypothetical protein|nr:hypothetical protein [Candidatus Acidoferrum sp.]
MPPWVEIVVKLTPAFITLVIGLIASLVAYLQYKNNRDKLRLDLFEKRLQAFEKLQEFFTYVLREGCVREEALPILAEARYKSRFLFGSEIEAFFDEVWKKAVDMLALRSRLYGPNSLPVSPERNKVCDQESALLIWQMEQMKNAHKIYSPYLGFKR